MIDKIRILDYKPEYKKYFKDLSIEWLKKYVSVEPEDERILNNPEDVIINPGGKIFFIEYDGLIVGTISLIKIDDKIYELAKLAVTEEYQGLGLGSLLMDKALDFVKEDGGEKIILFTARKLNHAIDLYEEYGFKEVDLISNKYIESDMKMEKLIYGE